MKEEIKNFYKILFIIFLFVFVFKLFSFLKYKIDKDIEIKREEIFNISDMEKIKAENSLQIAKVESQRIIIKACYDNKEIIDFITCIKELRK